MRIEPDSADVYNNRGDFVQAGKTNEATPQKELDPKAVPDVTGVEY
jgi:hypothetical protein